MRNPVIWAARSSLHFTFWRTSSVEHRIDFFSRTPYRFLQSNTVSISSVEHRIDFFSRTPYRFLQSNTVSISSVEHPIDFSGEILQHCYYAMIRWWTQYLSTQLNCMFETAARDSKWRTKSRLLQHCSRALQIVGEAACHRKMASYTDETWGCFRFNPCQRLQSSV